METFKKEFIEFMVRSGVLTFGDFTTKSGRKTPFFINTGNYDNGAQMEKLGEYYAQAIQNELGDEFDGLYGPAYKGIPLCITTSVALNRLFKKNAYLYQRITEFNYPIRMNENSKMFFFLNKENVPDNCKILESGKYLKFTLSDTKRDY